MALGATNGCLPSQKYVFWRGFDGMISSRCYMGIGGYGLGTELQRAC